MPPPFPSRAAFILTTGATGVRAGSKKTPLPPTSPYTLMAQAIEQALAPLLSSKLVAAPHEIDGLVACPPGIDTVFMSAHQLASHTGILPASRDTPFWARTSDVGGASPVSCVIQAARAIEADGLDSVVVAAGDTFASAPVSQVLHVLGRAILNPDLPQDRSSLPVVPLLYDAAAHWHLKHRPQWARNHLAMVSSLMHRRAIKYPGSLAFQDAKAGALEAYQKRQTPDTRRTDSALTLHDVLGSGPIGGHTTLFECARRADGAAAAVLVSGAFLNRNEKLVRALETVHGTTPVQVLGAGESSRTVKHPVKVVKDGDAHTRFEFVERGSGGGASTGDHVSESTFNSCKLAAQQAYAEAGLSSADIDYWGIYDCFPVVFLRALEDLGVCAEGAAGPFVELLYDMELRHRSVMFPVNHHGGLLHHGAPGEAPAMFSVLEAVRQLSAKARSGKPVSTALVYGNGGIMSHSAVVVLKRAA